MRKRGRSSVRRRIVLIYFMLVFTAMTIVSVYLLSSIESYQSDSLRDNITNAVEQSKLLSSLGSYDDLSGNADRIQEVLSSNWTGTLGSELSVVDKKLRIVASTNTALPGKSAADVFDSAVIASSILHGGCVESKSENAGLSVKNFCFRIEYQKNGEATGVVYVRSDLSAIERFMGESRRTFVRGISLALLITAVLGFILAGSITVPINSVTETVEKMSQGDFTNEIAVKSDDEIGRLAEMFNLLREKLDHTLAEISNEKNKLDAILESMSDGLIAVDPDGVIIHINPAAAKMLGLSKDLEGKNYRDVLAEFTEGLGLENVKKSAEGGKEVTFRLGESVIGTRCDSFKDETGKDAGTIFIMQDITERRKLEDMQTDFVANVSHELKTPLTNIKGYTETLLDGAAGDPETASRFLTVINSETDRMNRLVRDILRISRLDKGMGPVATKECNITDIVNTAFTKVEMMVKQKKQQMNRLYDPGADIRVMLDPDSFEQVLLNIFSNAIKYTGEGGRVDVDIYEKEGKVKLTVQDNGIGIPASALPRIFERFYRVDKARTRAMGGTGLGLAITKQIVESHSGTIEAQSREGYGTRMIITLPAARKDAGA